MLVYYGQPLQLFDKKDGMMYEVRVLLKELTGTDRYETSDFNQKWVSRTKKGGCKKPAFFIL